MVNKVKITTQHLLQFQQQQQQQQQQPQTIADTGHQTSLQDQANEAAYASRQAALPPYRPAPTYADVMQRKISQAPIPQPTPKHVQSSQQIHHDFNQNIVNSRIYAQSEEGLAYSQPEIHTHPHSVNYSTEGHGHYNIGSGLPDYSGQSVSMFPDIFQDQATYLQYRLHDRPTNLSMQPTYSSPELNTQGLPQEYAVNNMFNMNESYVYQYKPPPPYPRASNSTPDLAAQTGSRLISDSPDLLSRKTLRDSGLSSHSNLELSIDNLSETIPEVVQISADTVETESGIEEVQQNTTELDDASSVHSDSTFHVKETDSETEDSFVRSIPQRQSSTKSLVKVRFVSPSKAPPPSTMKEVATKRESFRSMMIARSGSFTPGVLRENAGSRLLPKNRSLRVKDKASIEEPILETSRTSNKSNVNETPVTSEDPVKLNIKNVLDKVTQDSISISSAENNVAGSGREVMRSQSDVNKPNKVKVIHEKAVSVDSSTERQQLLDKLKFSEPDVCTITENERVIGSKQRLVDYEESDSDPDTPSSPIGPLKLAAMNGLTMSRPMVLALMNDETRAPKDERVCNIVFCSPVAYCMFICFVF